MGVGVGDGPRTEREVQGCGSPEVLVGQNDGGVGTTPEGQEEGERGSKGSRTGEVPCDDTEVPTMG